MKGCQLSVKEWGERIILALLFGAIESLIIIVFSPLRPLLGKTADYLGRIGLILILGVATLLVRRNSRYKNHAQLWFGLLILAVAVSLDWVLAIYLIDYLGVNANTQVGYVLLKLNECAVIVCVIILFTRMSHNSLGSIYIQRAI